MYLQQVAIETQEDVPNNHSQLDVTPAPLSGYTADTRVLAAASAAKATGKATNMPAVSQNGVPTKQTSLHGLQEWEQMEVPHEGRPRPVFKVLSFVQFQRLSHVR